MSSPASKRSFYPSDPQILPIGESHDVRLVGGKAAGLAALMKAGFSVPRGLCVTTAVYHLLLRAEESLDTEAWERVWQLSEDQRPQELARIRSVLHALPWARGFLAAAAEIAGLPNLWIAGFATDGTDGIKPVAGAIVDGRTANRAKRANLNLLRALQENNSFPIFKKLAAHIVTGPTGTNVNDLYLLLAL